MKIIDTILGHFENGYGIIILYAGAVLSVWTIASCSMHKTVSLPQDEAQIIETVAKGYIADNDAMAVATYELLAKLREENRAPTESEWAAINIGYGIYSEKSKQITAAIEVIKSRLSESVDSRELLEFARALLRMF